VLAQSETLGATAALHALTLGEIETAVEILEQGRAVFWSHHLRLRGDFNTLPTELSLQLEYITQRLQLIAPPQLNESHDVNESNAAIEKYLSSQRHLKEEFEALILKTREGPGLERFMLPNAFDSLARTAHSFPVVTFITNSDACMAIIMRPKGSPLTVLLSNFSQEHARQIVTKIHANNKFHRGSISHRALKKASFMAVSADNALEELWSCAIKPVIQRLKLLVS
jgi:hypothetical protein